MGIKLVTHPFNKDCNATQRILNVIATNTTRSPRTEASEYVCHQPPSIMRYYNVFHSSSLARSRPVPTGRTAYIKVMKRSLRVAALVALCGESVQAFHVCRFFFPPSDSLSGTAKRRMQMLPPPIDKMPSRIYQFHCTHVICVLFSFFSLFSFAQQTNKMWTHSPQRHRILQRLRINARVGINAYPLL